MDLLTANDRDGQYPSSWYAETATPLPPFPVAQGALTCDVCVIGGGFTGLSAALHLAERGYDVAADAPLRSFAWSSWPAYLLARAKRPAWLQVDRLLGEWGIPKDSPAGRQRLE